MKGAEFMQAIQEQLGERDDKDDLLETIAQVAQGFGMFGPQQQAATGRSGGSGGRMDQHGPSDRGTAEMGVSAVPPEQDSKKMRSG